MVKEIKIGGKKCRLKSSAAVLRAYRMTFGEDLIVGMNNMFQYIMLQKKLNVELKAQAEASNTEFEPVNTGITSEHIKTLENFLYILHKQGDPNQPDNIDDWLDQFGLSDIYEAFPTVIDIWLAENKQVASAKKKKE